MWPENPSVARWQTQGYHTAPSSTWERVHSSATPWELLVEIMWWKKLGNLMSSLCWSGNKLQVALNIPQQIISPLLAPWVGVTLSTFPIAFHAICFAPSSLLARLMVKITHASWGFPVTDNVFLLHSVMSFNLDIHFLSNKVCWKHSHRIGFYWKTWSSWNPRPQQGCEWMSHLKDNTREKLNPYRKLSLLQNETISVLSKLNDIQWSWNEMFLHSFLNLIFEAKSNKNIWTPSFFTWLHLCYGVPTSWAAENEGLATPCMAADVQRCSGTAGQQYPGRKWDKLFYHLVCKEIWSETSLLGLIFQYKKILQ